MLAALQGLLPSWSASPSQPDASVATAQAAADAASSQAVGEQELHARASGQAKADPYDPAPRAHYLSWEQYFMAVAFLSSKRSKDPNKQVGACIVSADNVILGIGYNGFPRGCSDTELPWAKLSREGDVLQTNPYVCHAELNAVLNKNAASLQGARLYVTMMPCNECAKLLIQAGIVEVIYAEGKLGSSAAQEPPAVPRHDGRATSLRPSEGYAAAKRLFDLAGVRLRAMGAV